MSLDSVIRKDVYIMAHPAEIARVVQNLLVNASKYGRDPDGKLEIFVNTGMQGGRAILSVADRGEGIPEAEMERVLRPFERGRTGPNRVYRLRPRSRDCGPHRASQRWSGEASHK